MSGTSLDGIDGIIASFEPNPIIYAHHYQPYPDKIKSELAQLIVNQHGTFEQIGSLEQKLSEQYALAANALKQEGITLNCSIKAVGCHGQTLYHQPNGAHPFSWQLVNGHLLTQRTQLPAITDFRRMNMAIGGQGAPLAPLFHDAIFKHPNINRAIINIGGIANASILRPGHPFIGFDTGPGNTLIDQWTKQHRKQDYDKNGEWAAQGQINQTLLDRLQLHPYFSQSIPKSTGRELFNLAWLNTQLTGLTVSPVDIQNTITELTAATIANAIQPYQIEALYLCGGGAYNDYLKRRLAELTDLPCQTTDALGIAPNHVEASLIAWLTKQRIENKALSLDQRQKHLFGVIYQT